MYEGFLYIGIVLAVFFFITSVIIFYTQRIPEVMRFYIRQRNQKFVKNLGKDLTIKVNINKASGSFNSDTTTFRKDETQLIHAAQNYATALLDAESTHALSSLSEIHSFVEG